MRSRVKHPIDDPLTSIPDVPERRRESPIQQEPPDLSTPDPDQLPQIRVERLEIRWPARVWLGFFTACTTALGTIAYIISLLVGR